MDTKRRPKLDRNIIRDLHRTKVRDIHTVGRRTTSVPGTEILPGRIRGDAGFAIWETSGATGFESWGTDRCGSKTAM